jgi:valyl-tRNA synthetase
VAPGKMIDVILVPASSNGASSNDVAGMFEREAPTIARLTRSTVSVAAGAPAGAAAHAILSGGSQLVVPLAGLIDLEKECVRLKGELATLQQQITSRQARLDNPKYVERAPTHVVEGDRATLAEMKTKRDQISDKVRSLCGA